MEDLKGREFMQKTNFDITGMTCAACSARVEKSVKKLPGIEQVSVNLLKNSMTASYDESQLSAQQIISAVEKAGYGAYVHEKAKKAAQPSASAASPTDAAQQASKKVKQRLIFSIIFTVPLFYLSMGHMMGWPLPGCFLGTENALTYAFTQFLLLLPVVFVNFKY